MPVIELPSARIHYQVSGAGEPLLLLSANPGSHQDFQDIVPELSRHFRVIAPDWPGYGQSVLQGPHQASADVFLQVFSELVQALNLPSFSILGNSVGGNVAVRYALQHPQQVSRLLLVSPGGFTPHNGLTRTFCRWMGSRYGLSPSLFAQLYLRRRTPVVQQMLQRARTEQASVTALAVNRAVWRSFLQPQHDLRQQAQALAMPVMLVFGRYDPVIAAWLDGRVARRVLPAAVYCVLPCGHAPFAEMPTEFLRQGLPFLSAGLPDVAAASGSGAPA